MQPRPVCPHPRQGAAITTTAINLLLYRVLRALQVPEDAAQAAAEAAPIDLSHLVTRDDVSALATKDELRAEMAGVRTEIAGVRTEIAQAEKRQTNWLAAIVIVAAGAVIASQRLLPPPLPNDAIQAAVEQTLRRLQAGPLPGPAGLPKP